MILSMCYLSELWIKFSIKAFESVPLQQGIKNTYKINNSQELFLEFASTKNAKRFQVIYLKKNLIIMLMDDFIFKSSKYIQYIHIIHFAVHF